MLGRDSHDDAVNEAWARLSALDPATVAKNSGSSWKTGSRQLVMKVAGGECVIDLDARTVFCVGRKGEVSPHLKVLILHYLGGSVNAPLANRLVSYRDFEGGALYYQAFKSRTIDVIVREFGQKPDALKSIGDVLRAERMTMGNVSFKAYFFPKMPVVVVLWLGDDEVPASANILFDANAGRILPTEDLSVLGGVLCGWLVKLERA